MIHQAKAHLSWDIVARRYVERSDDVAEALETFGTADEAAPLEGRYNFVGNTVYRDGEPTYVLPPARVGDFLQTYSGRKFWPLDPRVEDVAIEDIAHSLAHQCRYGGHSLEFYSVAEHSVLMSRFVPQEHALWALLHDAAEAYLADVPRPLKRHLPGYKEAEARVMSVICQALGLPDEMPAVVHEADNRILSDEIRQNMMPMDWHAKHANPLGVTLRFWSPSEAEDEFLLEFYRLAADAGERMVT